MSPRLQVCRYESGTSTQDIKMSGNLLKRQFGFKSLLDIRTSEIQALDATKQFGSEAGCDETRCNFESKFFRFIRWVRLWCHTRRNFISRFSRLKLWAQFVPGTGCGATHGVTLWTNFLDWNSRRDFLRPRWRRRNQKTVPRNFHGRLRD